MKLKNIFVIGLFILLFVAFCMCVNKYDEKAIKYYDLGTKYQKLGDYETAILYYNKALEIEPDYIDAWYNKGVAFCKLGKYNESIKCFDIVLEINPNHEEAEKWQRIAKLLSEAKSYESKNNYEEAIKYYDKALEINPNLEIAKNNKQRALEKLKEIEEINNLLREAKDYKHNEDYEKAVECYKEVLDKDNKNLDALFGIGYCLCKLRKYDEALIYWDKYLELNPDDAKAWNGKGWTLYYLDRCEEAIKCFDKALDINPNYAFAWNGKGNALRKLGKCEEAIKCFDKALEIKPDYAFAWYNKGWTLMKLAKYDEAIKCFDKALEIDPNYDAAKKAKENAIKKMNIKKTVNIVTNLEKEPIGTYKNPAKVGEVVRATYKFLGRTYIYDISVEDYIRGDTANNIIKNANMFNKDPKSGYEYLLVKVKIKYVSGEYSDDINPLDFKVYYNGAGYDYAWVVLPDDYPELELVRLMPGGETEGWLAYEVPKNKEVLIAFEKLYEPLCFIKIE